MIRCGIEEMKGRCNKEGRSNKEGRRECMSLIDGRKEGRHRMQDGSLGWCRRKERRRKVGYHRWGWVPFHTIAIYGWVAHK